MRSHRLVVVCAVLILGSTLFASQTSKAPDLTGTWTGTFTTTTSNGPDEDPAHMVLKHSGAELTGTAGPRPDRQMPLTNGKVTTVKGVTTVTFEVAEPNGAKIAFDLKLVDGRLKGSAKAEMNGQTRDAVLDVGRAK
ncbi:MAG TPA: hypothetical protein VFO19_09510 [Vicinamibacterales bacterium]|nr:hypothetical protein [Vicinamibacterales bacterium]